MDYQFPLPKLHMPSAEFDKMKADYVAKYGYTIHIPGLTDIIKLGRPKEPTQAELNAYKRKDVAELGQARFDEIKQLKQEKKEAFLRMLSSPNPKWMQNIGSMMTFLDDINDSLGSLGIILRAGASLLPKSLAKFMLGPAGWLWSLADIVGMAMDLMRSPLPKKMTKHDLRKLMHADPTKTEFQVKKQKWLNRIVPSKGEVIELLQTTQQAVGIGLSLGPIVGALEEAITGPFRVLQGHKVDVEYPIPQPQNWELEAMEGITATQQLNMGSDELSDEDHIKSYICSTMAIKGLYRYMDEYNPLQNIKEMEYIQPRPRRVKHPLTRLILEEEGLDPEKHIGWLGPSNNNPTVQEIAEAGAETIPGKLAQVMERTKHTTAGWIGAQCASDTAMNGVALIEGPENIIREDNAVQKALNTIIDNGYMFRTEPSENERKCMVNAVINLAPDPYNIEFKDLQYLLYTRCRIMFIRRPEYSYPTTEELHRIYEEI